MTLRGTETTGGAGGAPGSSVPRNDHSPLPPHVGLSPVDGGTAPHSLELPYPEAPLASRRAPGPDWKPEKRVKDQGVYAQFHSLGLRCLHCTSTVVEAAHLLRGIKREDVLAALVPLCRFCHEAFDTARNVYYPIFVSVSAVKASVARHLRSAAGDANAAYLIRVLGPLGADDYLQRLEAA